uniref:UBC core domain-containing protein n=1 Tax=Glossina brevipalpis TaxID=37001 RepID=A0A1A9WWD7_9MUSC
MTSPTTNKRRIDKDIMKLLKSKHEVIITGGLNEFQVKFFGPLETPYQKGVWKVNVYLPDDYPFKSPSIQFVNKIYHPNIGESSGTVCVDVINQAWTALYDLSNIFECFLPQLLTYPNPTDPLNREAARLFINEPEEYNRKVVQYVQRYAIEVTLNERENSDSESSMSDYSEQDADKHRKDSDIIKLIESKHEVIILGGLNEFQVKFFGPGETPYQKGVWKVRVYLPDNYPFKSPSIGFVNKIYHPNIDESSGTVCLDVINQAWTPLYNLSNIFECFLPQLLTYPNPTDPLNREAATLYMHAREAYDRKVVLYVQRYATEEALRAAQVERESSDSESSMSDYSVEDARDMEV